MRTSAADDPSLPDHPVQLRYNALIARAQDYARVVPFATSAAETEALARRCKLSMIWASYVLDASCRMMSAAPDELPQA